MLRGPMRRGGMPLVRAAATTAVVAGTAGAVRHHQDQKWANQSAQQQAVNDQQQMAVQMDAMAQQQAMLEQQNAMLAQQVQQQQMQQQMQQQAPAPQVAAPAATAMDDTVAQLQKLAELQKAGILTQEEFAAKKKQLLGI